jgi:UDP-N-acetylglucosamine diphosphorylase / glucose-1-phosphate thymidylyltransferase / UDP-N-acetylgalactosamine diphosphorylase / glucosamine-1-phosphate N-acetyltransferase / galactosamine-1-phosphate N-acetyltransferase
MVEGLNARVLRRSSAPTGLWSRKNHDTSRKILVMKRLPGITERAIVLARGLGTRMRARDPSVQLTPEQQRAADSGVKAMMPLNGRPFLDFILGSLADAGIRFVALVVAPDHRALRRHYEVDAPPRRIRLDFVVQPEPLGTANAVLVTEPWVDRNAFLAMNADNLYPTAVLRELVSLGEPGLPAFEPGDLVASSNISAERIGSFASLEIDEGGYLVGIVEKPGKTDGESRRSRTVSMNCWRFDQRIFSACRKVPKSKRGEFELPEAVGLAVRQGVKFRAFPALGPVLDLSTRADAADVARRLASTIPHP